MIWIYRFRLVLIVLNGVSIGTNIVINQPAWSLLSAAVTFILVAQIWTPETK